MEKQIRTRLFTDDTVAVCTEDISRTTYLEGYVFVDENEVLTHADIQAIFEMIEERGLEIDTYTVQGIADEMCPGAAISDIGGTHIHESDYHSNMWVFEGYNDDEIYTIGDLDFTDTVFAYDGGEYKAIYLNDDDDIVTYNTDNDCVWLNAYLNETYCRRYIYRVNKNTYILDTVELTTGALDHADVYTMQTLVQELLDLTGEYDVAEIKELIENIEALEY